MITTRRDLIALTAAGAALTACGVRTNQHSHTPGLDLDRLTRGFAPLAARALPSRFNLGVLSLADDKVWCADSDGRYPMQSVFKAPLAAAALAEVDAGRLTLNEAIPIGELDLSPPPSLINQRFQGAMSLPAADLIALAVQQSDNTATDVIMKRIGGPGAVTAWLQAKGIADLRVDRYERELQTERLGMPSFRAAWKDAPAFDAARDLVPASEREAATRKFLADPRDTTTAPAALSFLNRLADGRLLSPASTRLLLRLMTTAVAGPDRLRAGLPAGARLAHKAGSSGTDLGITPATNDIGLITLADGRRLAIVTLLAGSTATDAERDRLIADATRLAVAAMG